MRVVGTLLACAVAGAPLVPGIALAQQAIQPVSQPAAGGPPARADLLRPIPQDAYDLWRTIQGATLSDDGRWVAYSLSPVVGDGELVVRATGSTTEHRVPRGWLGRPVTSLTGGGGGGPLPPARFSPDSRWVAALVYAPMSEFERARQSRPARGGRGGGATEPKASLALLSLADGSVARMERVKSFALPERAGAHLAYLLEPADSAAARANKVSASG